MRRKRAMPSAPDVVSAAKFMSWITRSTRDLASIAMPSSGDIALITSMSCNDRRTDSAIAIERLSSMTRTTGTVVSMAKRAILSGRSNAARRFRRCDARGAPCGSVHRRDAEHPQHDPAGPEIHDRQLRKLEDAHEQFVERDRDDHPGHYTDGCDDQVLRDEVAHDVRLA